ncbi:pentapeptide repeat-containing protein [Pseudomonas fluorescens]|uniref:E3 ubiquitin-protein ligase SopA-like catalytic domain-containing protein n=1 Tax=Pseudomonas fluorescens TaxID=294 RepID=A0A5E7QAI8_PSEFL|nr:pentapeptide repeat-containing protein [Pseudomonas fluorescens]VVP59186.1 hypothetical protein PS880_06004 [Pseudomonas fluorescens]
MPTVYVHTPSATNIMHEPTEVLSNLAMHLRGLTNTASRLLLGNNLLEAETGNTRSENSEQKKIDACIYFNRHERFTSVHQALFEVNQILSKREEIPFQDPKVVYCSQLASQNISFSSPIQSEIDSIITKLFFDTVGQIPSSEDRVRFVDMYIGLAALQNLGLSAITKDAALIKNGTIGNPTNLIIKMIGLNNKQLNCNQLDKLAEKLLASITLDQSVSIGALDNISAETRSKLIKKVRFVGTDLSRAALDGISLRAIHIGAPSEGGLETQRVASNAVDFSAVKLRQLDISDSSFSNAILKDSSWSKIKSTGTDYKNATLSGAYFYTVDFSESDFSGADLTGIHCQRANFSGANLTGAKISLSPDFLRTITSSEFWVDDLINHLNNENQGLLISINSIDSKFEAQKNYLMAQVIAELDSLEVSELGSCWASLGDVLLKEPCYAKDPDISRFILNKLLPHWINEKNQARLRPDEVNLTVALTSLSASTLEWSALDFQGAVNQLLCAATLSENRAELQLQQAEEQLRTAYLRSPVVNEAVVALEGLEKDLPRETYIFTSSDRLQAVALDPELFKSLVFAGMGEPDLTNAYFLTRASETESFMIKSIADLSHVYAMQPLLKACYAAITQGGISGSLVRGILGNSPHSAAFIEALNLHSIPNNLVATAHQGELYDTFATHWQVARGEIHEPQNTSRHLRPEHQEQLWLAGKDLALEDTPHNRAALMLSLSSIFTRYSSSHLFGTEGESPTAVRLYASALLNEARLLDPSLIDDDAATDWQARLLGIGDAFTCTALLSYSMDGYVKDNAQPGSPLEHVSLALYPAAWR